MKPISNILTEIQLSIREKARQHVNFLAGTLGERNFAHSQNLKLAADYIAAQMNEAGLSVSEQHYTFNGQATKNIIGEKKGAKGAGLIVIGAHYDTVVGSPGADDNASGVAAILILAELFRGKPIIPTIRFIAFSTEEPPAFLSNQMGSWHYAKMLKKEHEKVIAMFSLESIGYYSDAIRSQRYPLLLSALYPSTGNFIGFVANMASSRLLSKALYSFRENSDFPVEGIAAPTFIPGISWSDQISFWKMGYKALMITDTVPYRNPHYHLPSDLPDTLDYDSMARVIHGLFLMFVDLASM